MNRSKYGMAMASPRSFIVLMATLNFVAFTWAGPLGPLPMQNMTTADLGLGLKQGSCALGDVVYKSGDEFPGSSPCERCTCSAGGVHCAQQTCEPRPGCKALHRPDHCCPVYQCECEQEGRVYGNGEKLVDPQDPCRVCYCQGGEVVCRRIACFVRDDCTPRLVPGRCCPEYDNCPLRGVTTLPGMTSSVPTISSSRVESTDLPAAAANAPKEVVKQEITIKEITPVSEIPIITDVRIKEILPSPSIEVEEYAPSKSPLMPREATSEKSTNTDSDKRNQEMPSVVEVHSAPEPVSLLESETSTENKDLDALAPSKISLSTQDSINSEIYPSDVPMPAVITLQTTGSPATPDTRTVAGTTKAPVIDEEDPLLFDHNPAFPPLPDDLSVLSNHGDEIVPEPSAEADPMTAEHAPLPQLDLTSGTTTTTEAEATGPLSTTAKYIYDTSVSTTEKAYKAPKEPSAVPTEASTTAPFVKENPTIKLRSAIPTETFSSPSEDVAMTEGKQDEVYQTSTNLPPTSTNLPATSTTLLAASTIALGTTMTEVPDKLEETTAEEPEAPTERVSFLTSSPEQEIQNTTQKETEITTNEASSSTPRDEPTSSIAKSNIATEVTSQTELSSLPIETSDQNPHEASENISKDNFEDSTLEPIAELSTITERISAANSEVVTVARADSRAIENVETTEFILTSFGSSESSTDGVVELIKISGDADKSAAIVDRADAGTGTSRNALKELITLVRDVATMREHTEAPVSESEELIPVNVGYKSKNSNFNQNSITEVPTKSKSVTSNKQKVVEIDEDDETAGITDSPVPGDRAEPTTRRALIDHVDDDMPQTGTGTEKKDIEIITQSYVPTINRRPTKVIQQEELPMEDTLATSAESATDGVTSRDSFEEELAATRRAHQ